MRVTMNHLPSELDALKERHPALEHDELFVLWFILAALVDDEGTAAGSLIGGPNDRNIDALLVDDDAKVVYLVQGKHRQAVGVRENRNDVLAFARIAKDLTSPGDGFHVLIRDANPPVAAKLRTARERITKRDYRLELFFVTSGTVASKITEEAGRMARTRGGRSRLSVFDHKRLPGLLESYLEGVAPPVPTMQLTIEAYGTASQIYRPDHRHDIESWVFTVRGDVLTDLYNRAHEKLFARNIRGYLGTQAVNRAIDSTLRNEPENFWYFNNGVTMVCDAVEQVTIQGQSSMIVTNAQIINGQQTTRTLAASPHAKDAAVLVRLIRLPPEEMDLVTEIVSATNSQSQITQPDLKSNDKRQIMLARQMSHLNYYYMRKRTTRGEARRLAIVKPIEYVTKEEIAQIVAAVELDPQVALMYKSRLFEDGEGYYRKIFNGRPAQDYLACYWISRVVARGRRGARSPRN